MEETSHPYNDCDGQVSGYRTDKRNDDRTHQMQNKRVGIPLNQAFSFSQIRVKEVLKTGLSIENIDGHNAVNPYL